MAQQMGALLEVARIQSEINRLFDNLVDIGSAEQGRGAWIPNTDISETAEELIFKIELPGVRGQELAVSSHGGDVIIEGDKQPDPDLAGVQPSSGERAYGRFRRVLHLSAPVNTRQADARFVDGLLTLRFPKVPNRRGEVVAIEVITS